MLVHALQKLEFDHVRERLAENCETPAGRSSALEIEPSFEEERVWWEVTRTSEAGALLDDAPVALAGIGDVAEAVVRAQKHSSIDGATLWRVGSSMRVMRKARKVLDQKRSACPLLWSLGERLPELDRLEDRILTSLDGDGTVRDEASAELKSSRQRALSLAQRATEKVQSYASGRWREYLSDGIVTQRGGRYVVPLKAEHRGKIKGIVHDTSASGQTLFVEPEDVVQIGNDLREAEAKVRAEEERVLRELSEEVGEVAEDVLDGLDAAGELDLVLAKARLSGCLPTKKGVAFLRMKTARHPQLEQSVAVPMDVTIGREHDAVLITGPNTGGKTVAIKTIGLAVAMAQCGMPVCAAAMELGVFSQLWVDIGDEQSLQQSLSTFSGHVKNIAEAVRGLLPGALVLLDEIGAGTDPAEGAALGRALLIKFQKGGAKVVASTHYGELKIFASNAPGFVNASMEFDNKTLRPTYRFQLGVPGSSQAFRIAERHGIPRDVIEEALLGVRSEELDVSKMIERLEVAQKQAQAAQGEADRLSARVRQLEKEAEEKIAKAQEAREGARREAAAELEEVLAEIRSEAEEVFASLKAGSSQAEIEGARARIKGIQQRGAEAASGLRPAKKRRAAPSERLCKGTTVRLVELGQTGIVIEEPKGDAVNVQVGPLKMRVRLTDVEFVCGPKQAERKPRASSARLKSGLTASREVQIRMMRAEDAQEALERFLDEAVLAGLPSVRIVHGKGEGVLRKMTRELLRKHPHVKRYGDATPEEGGQGATVAEFE